MRVVVYNGTQDNGHSSFNNKNQAMLLKSIVAEKLFVGVANSTSLRLMVKAAHRIPSPYGGWG